MNHMSDHITFYSVHYNRADFILLQHLSLRRFCNNPYDLVIVNNARDVAERVAISKMCDQVELDCIETFSDAPFSLAGRHHQEALNKVWQDYVIKDISGIVGVMDGDVFLLRELDLIPGNWTIRASPQHRKGYHYVSPVIALFNKDVLTNVNEIDWLGTEVAPTVHLDSGGNTYYYLTKYPQYKDKTIVCPQTWHISDANGNMHVLPDKVRATYQQGFDVEVFDQRWLHYCASSSWKPYESAEFHKTKSKWVEDFVYGCVNDSIVFNPPYFNMQNQYLGWPSE